MLFSRRIFILELFLALTTYLGSQPWSCCHKKHQGHMKLPCVNPKVNLCLIPCPAKTYLAAYTLLSLQLLCCPHLFIVFTPVCMLLAGRSAICTVTSTDKSCPWLIQNSINFLFSFSSLAPSLEHICFNSIGCLISLQQATTRQPRTPLQLQEILPRNE